MALTFPRSMPTVGTDSQSFSIGRVDYLSPENGGRMGGVSAGFPLWRMRLTLNNTDVDEIEEWISFLDAQDGAQRPFLGSDLTRPYPKAYLKGFAGMTRYGGGAFDAGTTAIWSVNGTRDVLALGGLPANFQISRRDYVGFQWATAGQVRRALVRSVEPVVGSALGVATFTVRPALPMLVPAGAVATLARPDCLMKLVTSETSIGELDPLHSAGGTVVAVQELLA